MSYLIDTHILLWWLNDDKKLSNEAREIIKTQPVWVSTAVVWEIVIKSQLGKLIIPDNLEDTLSEEGFMMLDIKVGHTIKLFDLEPIHSDPFDRIQIAQAIVENLTLITKDKNIKKYPLASILRV